MRVLWAAASVSAAPLPYNKTDRKAFFRAAAGEEISYLGGCEREKKDGVSLSVSIMGHVAVRCCCSCHCYQKWKEKYVRKSLALLTSYSSQLPRRTGHWKAAAYKKRPREWNLRVSARCLYGFFLLGAHIMLCGAKAKKRRGGIKFIRRTLLLLSFLCAPTALYFYEVYEKSTSATRYNNNKTRRRNNDDKMMLLRVLLADNFWCLLWPRANKRVKAATESYSLYLPAIQNLHARLLGLFCFSL